MMKFFVENYIFMNFHFVGVHPSKRDVFAVCRTLFSIAVMSTMIVLTTIEVFLTWESIETLSKAEIIPALSMGVFAMISLHMDNKSWKKILHQMMYFRKTEEFSAGFRDKLSHTNKIYKGFLIMYLTTVTFTVGLMFLKPLLVKELPFSIYKLCDTNETLCYVNLFSLQLVNQTCALSFVLSFDMFFLYLVNRVQNEFRALKYTIKTLVMDGVGEIHNVMRHHVLILNVVATMNEVYSNIMLFQYWFSTLTICLGLFLMTINGIPPSFEHLSKYASFVMSFLMQLGIYCVGGSILIEESVSVSDAAFNTDWWIKTQPEIRKSLVLLILRSQRPAALTIGGVTNVALEKFPLVKVLKTSLSFFTLMQNLKGDESFPL